MLKIGRLSFFRIAFFRLLKERKNLMNNWGNQIYQVNLLIFEIAFYINGYPMFASQIRKISNTFVFRKLIFWRQNQFRSLHSNHKKHILQTGNLFYGELENFKN